MGDLGYPNVGYVIHPKSYDAAEITVDDVLHDSALRLLSSFELTEDQIERFGFS